jgi:hypothetical protein
MPSLKIAQAEGQEAAVGVASHDGVHSIGTVSHT